MQLRNLSGKMKQLAVSLNKIEVIMLLMTCFGLLLLFIRIKLTGNFAFYFLPWNLFLAYLPLFISGKMLRQRNFFQEKLVFAFFFLMWLLLFPNSFYILTDLFHLKLRNDSNRWFDLTIILSFAWTGLLMGVLSLKQMEYILKQRFRLKSEWMFLFSVMLLNALGIYIGRYMRFNSWDVITNPLLLINDVGYLIIHPIQNFAAWGTIGCFAILSTIIYLSIKGFAKNI